MGRHSDPPVTGSRRAVVLTVTASVLLVAGGIAVLRSSGGLHPADDEGPGPTPSRSIAVMTQPSGPPGPAPSSPVTSSRVRTTSD